MERLRASLMLVLVLACATHGVGGEPDIELWYDVTLDGVSIGHSRERIGIADDGNIVTAVSTVMLVTRRQDLVRLEISERWTETPAGEPLEYHMTMHTSGRETALDLVIDGETARLRRAIGEDASVESIHVPVGLRFPAAMKRLMVSQGGAPGRSYSYLGFDAETENVETFTVTIEGEETLEVLGDQRPLIRYTIECAARPGLPVREWRDTSGLLWRYELPTAGMALTRTTKENALAEKEAFDLLTASAVSSNVLLRAPYRVDDALVELWLDDGADIEPFMIEDARQSIEGRTDRGVLLRVARATPEPDEVMRFPVLSAPMMDSMEGNPLMQTWHPRLLGVAARQAWGTDQNIWRTSKNIEAWVFQEVDKKGFGTGFASATETLDSREGDCSEHAVLMAAMVRSLSIPARLASGLTHYQGEFLYHMWVEVWTGDEWYALDPTIGEGSVDAMHIKFGESTAKRGNVSDLALGILRVFGRLSLRVVEYTEGGETVRP